MEAQANNGKRLFVWYAVSGTGQGLVFLDRPERDGKWKTWFGHIDGCVSQFVSMMESFGLVLPPLRWSDEPVRLSLTIRLENED